jgi:hypothetical protein
MPGRHHRDTRRKLMGLLGYDEAVVNIAPQPPA